MEGLDNRVDIKATKEDVIKNVIEEYGVTPGEMEEKLTIVFVFLERQNVLENCGAEEQILSGAEKQKKENVRLKNTTWLTRSG